MVARVRRLALDDRGCDDFNNLKNLFVHLGGTFDHLKAVDHHVRHSLPLTTRFAARSLSRTPCRSPPSSTAPPSRSSVASSSTNSSSIANSTSSTLGNAASLSPIAPPSELIGGNLDGLNQIIIALGGLVGGAAQAA